VNAEAFLEENVYFMECDVTSTAAIVSIMVLVSLFQRYLSRRVRG
jgi:hypothetical protein